MNFHRFRFIIASTSEWKAIAPQTDSTSSFFHRLEFEAKSVPAELLSCTKKTRKCLPRIRAPSDTLCDSMIRSFSSLYFHSETTAKHFLAKLAACVSARGHKDRSFPELAPNTKTQNLLSDNLGRKSFSSCRCDQSERRWKMLFRDCSIAPESGISFCSLFGTNTRFRRPTEGIFIYLFFERSILEIILLKAMIPFLCFL